MLQSHLNPSRGLGLTALCLMAALGAACTSASTPRGMTEVAEPNDLHAGIVGGAAAAQTGAPAPSAPTMNKVQDGGEGQTPAALLAQEVYAQRCVLCHGPRGLGNGVAAENLRPKPRNLGDRAWQKATPDADIASIIVKGGAEVGRSMMMPANPDLAAKPEVVRALVAIVRSFGK